MSRYPHQIPVIDIQKRLNYPSVRASQFPIYLQRKWVRTFKDISKFVALTLSCPIVGHLDRSLIGFSVFSALYRRTKAARRKLELPGIGGVKRFNGNCVSILSGVAY